MNKTKTPRATVAQEMELLNRALQVEYSMIVQYPQFAEMIHDGEIKRLVQSLGLASIKHANVVSRAIVRLGGTPEWSFEFMERGIGMLRIFEKQLENEKLALEFHEQIVDLIKDESLKEEFRQLAEEEKQHIVTVKKIIAGLS